MQPMKKSLVACLEDELGRPLNPIFCGGTSRLYQEREQWTDGANAFAMAPGVILTYDRNERTAEELSKSGYEIVDENDLLLGKTELSLKKRKRKYVIRLAAHELSRARGGPRCMAMPLSREEVGV